MRPSGIQMPQRYNYDDQRLPITTWRSRKTMKTWVVQRRRYLIYVVRQFRNWRLVPKPRTYRVWAISLSNISPKREETPTKLVGRVYAALRPKPTDTYSDRLLKHRSPASRRITRYFSLESTICLAENRYSASVCWLRRKYSPNRLQKKPPWPFRQQACH